MPIDFHFSGVYMPPLLLASCLGLLAASATVRLISARGLAAHFSNPTLTYLSLAVIYTVIFGSTIFPT